MAVNMFSTTRYLVLGVAFVALTGATIIHTVPKIEADVHRQTSTAVDKVQSMVVSVDGRDVTLLGLIRTSSPKQMTPAVESFIDALNQLPAVNQLDASVDILGVEHNASFQAAQTPEPATIKRT